MVFQSYAVFPHMTLYDNIAFGLKMQKESKATIKERVDSVAELVHIEELLDRYPAQISGGQRQRVALARAIATKADVLLMDEPLSNLDALLRMEMRAELKALLRQLGTTTIYVTHDQVEALSMGDRIAVMKAGIIAQVDTPLAVYDHPADTYVGGFVGTPPMNFLHAEVNVERRPAGRPAERRQLPAHGRRRRRAGGQAAHARHPRRGDPRAHGRHRGSRAGEGDRGRAARLAQPAHRPHRRGHAEGRDAARSLPRPRQRRLARARPGADPLDGSRERARGRRSPTALVAQPEVADPAR